MNFRQEQKYPIKGAWDGRAAGVRSVVLAAGVSAPAESGESGASMRQAGRRKASCLPTPRHTTNAGGTPALARKKAKRVTAGETAYFRTLPLVASGDGDGEKAVGFRLTADCKSGLSARTTQRLQAIPPHCAVRGTLSTPTDQPVVTGSALGRRSSASVTVNDSPANSQVFTTTSVGAPF